MGKTFKSMEQIEREYALEAMERIYAKEAARKDRNWQPRWGKYAPQEAAELIKEVEESTEPFFAERSTNELVCYTKEEVIAQIKRDTQGYGGDTDD